MWGKGGSTDGQTDMKTGGESSVWCMCVGTDGTVLLLGRLGARAPEATQQALHALPHAGAHAPGHRLGGGARQTRAAAARGPRVQTLLVSQLQRDKQCALASSYLSHHHSVDINGVKKQMITTSAKQQIQTPEFSFFIKILRKHQCLPLTECL